MPFFLGTWLDPKVLAVVLVLPKWVAPNPPTEPALKPEFDRVVGCKPAGMPEFCCLPPTPGGANVTSRFAPPMLRSMAAMGIPPGDMVIVLVFAAAAAAMVAIGVPPKDKGIALAIVATAVAVATFVGGEVGVCAIVGVAWRELGLDKLCEYLR